MSALAALLALGILYATMLFLASMLVLIGDWFRIPLSQEGHQVVALFPWPQLCFAVILLVLVILYVRIPKAYRMI
jgi:uncharacterized BrkB/YihY/UPF0761 family membrane protein